MKKLLTTILLTLLLPFTGRAYEKEIYRLDLSDVKADYLPPGWYCYYDEQYVNQYPDKATGGSRTYVGFTGYQGKALFWRTGYAEYGRQSEFPLRLTAGDYKLSFAMAAWKGTPQYKVKILNSANSAIKTGTYQAAPNANGSLSANVSSARMQVLSFRISKEGNYVIRFEEDQSAGFWNEYLLLALTLTQEVQEEQKIITFADAEVKRLCVENWDLNDDGELSESEAAAVKDLGAVFKNNGKVSSFDELQYFTGLTLISDDAFNGCYRLASVTIPSNVTSIGWNAFRACSALSTVILPEGVTTIGNYAFRNCSGLTSVTFPSTVTTIGYDVFRYCSQLKTVISHIESPFDIDANTFDADTYAGTLIVPRRTRVLYQAREGWKNFQNIVQEGDPTAVSILNDEVKIAIGGTIKLSTAFVPADAESVLMWRSDNEQVATVDGDGVVTGVAQGTAIITVTTENGLSASCEVMVVYDGPVDAVWEDTENAVVYAFNTGNPSAQVQLVKTTATGDVIIHDKFTYMGKEYTVTEVSGNAFAGAADVTSVTVPASVTTVGEAAFSNKGLLALVWQSDADVPADILPEEGERSKNFLLYVNRAGQAPYGMSKVLVKTGDGYQMQGTLTLQENEGFHCPVAFKAEAVSYTHAYQMTSGIGTSEGWETLALPFDVETIRHADGRVLVPFASYRSDSDNRPFWLYAMSSDGFVKTASIKANTPYIICMPNNEGYLPEYNIAGEVTFTANNVTIQPTTSLNSVTAGARTFVPTFRKIRSSGSVATLNSVNRLHSNTGGEAPGSRFISNLRLASPFEAVFEGSASNVRSFAIDFAPGVTNGIDEVPTSRSGQQRIYNLKGQRVSTMQRGQLYIVDGRKLLSR